MQWISVLSLICLFGFVEVSGLAAAVAQTPKKLEVIVFPGGFNWPIWAAQQGGS